MNKADCSSNDLDLYSEGARTAAFLAEIFGGFPCSMQANSRIMS